MTGQCHHCGHSLRARSGDGREQRASLVNARRHGAPCPHCGVVVHK